VQRRRSGVFARRRPSRPQLVRAVRSRPTGSSVRRQPRADGSAVNCRGLRARR
jgi:hypothetical protein